MTRRNPFEELEQLFDRMSQQVEPGEWRGIGGPAVTIDLLDVEDALLVVADLPGYEREQIDLTVAEDTLRIEAERDEDEEEAGEYLRRERHRSGVNRSIRLPEPVDESDASASYQDGVLRITLPKSAPEDEGQPIDIE